MTKQELIEKVRELREYKRLAEETADIISAIEGELKAEMDAENVDTLVVDIFKLTYKPITQTRIDGKALREELPDVAEKFTKTTTYKRFTVN